MSVNITFGIIVLNGEPFTRYCLRALYPYAHEIIIVEGACEGSRNIATSVGHSRDGTLELLREFKRLEDPENKISIVTAEEEGHPDGFWPGEKHEQCRAFAKRATGNYLWQVDIDEFYKDEDIRKIIHLLHDDPAISCISFNQIGFWGGFNYIFDSWYFKRHLPEIYRIFQWGKGYQLSTHRPPTVVNENKLDVRSGKWLKAKDMIKIGIFMYHYSFVFPKQVLTKADYYSNSNWLSLRANDWASLNYMRLTKPYRVFIITDCPSWLRKFHGTHPPGIQQLIDNIKEKITIIEERDTMDIEKLVNNRGYQLGCLFLKFFEPFDRWSQVVQKKIKAGIYRLNHVFDSV